MAFSITLEAGGTQVRLDDTVRSTGANMIITSDELRGLYDTPTAKTTLTERQTGNGAYDVTDSEVLYSARTVTIPVAVLTGDDGGPDVKELRDRIARLTGRMVRLTVDNSGQRSFVTGYLTVSWSGHTYEGFDTGTVTLVCPDPVRYSADEMTATLWPTSTGNIGLQYNSGLVYPLSYGKQATDDRSVGVLPNSGSALAYPVLTAHGQFSDGVQIDWHDSDGRSGSLWWQGHVGQVPLVLDCRSRTASMGGVDQSSGLARRAFPSVPAGGSLSLALRAGGTGYVSVTSHDTWI